VGTGSSEAGRVSEHTRVGVYPGSFNPPTVAHLAIAEAAVSAGRLDRVDLVVSRQPLGKDPVTVPSLDDRMALLGRMAARHPHLGVVLSPARLLVDIAEGADAVVLGADKWAQVVDPSWYDDDPGARDAAVARLPLVLVAPRPPVPLPAPVPDRIVILDLPPQHLEVSSTAARAGRREWMAEEAAAFDAETGAWSRPADYRAGSHHRHERDG
jgi:nicotinate-nucleotide adenylyltransferase